MPYSDPKKTSQSPWALLELVNNAPLPAEDKLRLHHFTAFVFLGVPLMAGFGVYNFLIDHFFATLLLAINCVTLCLGWLCMCHFSLGRLIYRLNGVLFAALLLAMVFLGGEAGSRSLWMFIFPMIAVFLLGRREGIAWAGALLVLGGLLLVFAPLEPSAFVYKKDFAFRFILVYLIIMVVSYWFEYFRENYRRAVVAEKELLKEVIETIPDAVAMKDREGRYILINGAFLDMYGLSEGTVLGRKEEEISGHKVTSRKQYSDLLRQVGSATERVEEQLKNGRGETSVYDTITVTLKNSATEGPGVLSVSRDITSMTAAEQGLMQGKRLLREILMHSGDILYRRNLQDGSYDYVSDAFCRLLGYTREEAERLSFDRSTDLIHPDYRQKHQELLDALLDGHGNSGEYSLEYPYRDKAGEYHWFSDRMTVVCGKTGKPEYIIGCNRDITEGKQAEKALQQAHEQTLTILEGIDAHVCVLDVERHRILYANKVINKAFGTSLVGEECWKIFRGKESPCADCTIPELLGSDEPSGGIIEQEVYNPVTDKWFMQFDRMIHWRENRLAKLQIAFDITRIKRLEKERRKDERLLAQAKKQEALSRMAGAVAHHLNNQLMIVRGYLEMAESESAGKPRLQHYLQVGIEAVQKTSEIGSLLLCYLGQQSGKLKYLDLAEICRDYLPTLNQLPPADIVLEADLLFPGMVVRSDPDLIEQMLFHLVTNSCEAIGDRGGIISLSLAPASADDMEEYVLEPKDWKPGSGNYCCLKIKDTGCGIGREDIEKIFDPFFSTKFTGRGLGLAMVLGLVKSWGGAIGVASLERQGTTIRLFIPLRDKELGDIPHSSQCVCTSHLQEGK